MAEGQAFQLIRHPAYNDWMASLRDRRARFIIDARVRRLAEGNVGDSKSVGDGVHELRVNHGPGYRIYFARRGNVTILLLCAGDKSSQSRDVERAKRLLEAQGDWP